jgi:hypothetical protein
MLFEYIRTDIKINSELSNGIMQYIIKDLELNMRIREMLMMNVIEFHFYILKFYDYSLSFNEK